MSQKRVLYHQDMPIFPDGLCPKQEELRMNVEDLIEIKHMIQDQLSEVKLILRIKQVQNVILDQVIDYKEIKQEHSKIKCKVVLVLNFIMLNGDQFNLAAIS